MATRTNRRNIQRVDYRQLAEGPKLTEERQKTNWSTRQYFELEVCDSKLENGQLFFKVHYIGWSATFDEWRVANEVIDIPEEFLQSSNETRSLVVQNLKLAIKEALHCQRKSDSLIELRVQIARDFFEEISKLCTELKRGEYKLNAKNSLNCLLGAGWHYRIINEHKDFAFIAGDVFFRLSEREPLREFSSEGQVTFLHRGYRLVMKFVRGKGNANDLKTFLPSV